VRRIGTAIGIALVMAVTGACGAANPGTPPSSAAVAPTSVAPAPQCPIRSAGTEPPVHVSAGSVDLPASPFGLAARGAQAFVALNDSIGVLATDMIPPRLVRTIPLPASLGIGGAAGLALTHDGRYLLAAGGPGLVVVDAATLTVLGSLAGTNGDTAVEVTVSPDDRYAFVSQETATVDNRGAIEVFDLHKALRGRFDPDAYVGSLTLGRAVVGTAVSGGFLYTTSEITPTGGAPTETGIGSLSVVSLRTLETNPAAALPHSVPAGCDPVRVAVAPDGGTVWVTARETNALLAFDAAKLATDPRHALLRTIPVGTAPVGLVFAGGRIVTADSDRFNVPGATTGLSVVDVQAALAGRSAVLGTIATGRFPREFALAGSTLLVSDFTSDQVQAINTATLP
jgi:DNA-binding beta-propeller fold protein YncE